METATQRADTTAARSRQVRPSSRRRASGFEDAGGHHIVRAQERQRIGQELHDGICQQITGIAFSTRVLQERLSRLGAGELVSEAGALVALLDQTLHDTRSIARDLAPLWLERLGLKPALHELAVSVRRLFGVRCVFVCSSAPLEFDATVAGHLYRIAQEAVTNSVRHGRATALRIALRFSEGIGHLIIEELGGAGFRLDQLPPSRSLGLHGMHNRALAIDGDLSIESTLGQGTCVICCLSSLSARDGETPALR